MALPRAFSAFANGTIPGILAFELYLGFELLTIIFLLHVKVEFPW